MAVLNQLKLPWGPGRACDYVDGTQVLVLFKSGIRALLRVCGFRDGQVKVRSTTSRWARWMPMSRVLVRRVVKVEEWGEFPIHRGVDEHAYFWNYGKGDTLLGGETFVFGRKK